MNFLSPIKDRDHLRDVCITAQYNICVICGKGLYGDAEVHESIVKRSDLPNDKRIFAPVNCCALHSHCHENTAAVDEACADWLIGRYGLFLIQDFLIGLKMKVYPTRAQIILRM